MEREGQRQSMWIKEGLTGLGEGGVKDSLKVLGLET